jgi:hypothetical protein
VKKRAGGRDLSLILEATDPEGTFEAARALGERGVGALPELIDALAGVSARDAEAPVWGVASAIAWVLQAQLEAIAAHRAPVDEAPFFDAIASLSAALQRLADGLEGPAIKIGTILGDELPRAAMEFLNDDLALPLRVRLVDRCRMALEAAAAGGRASAMTGAITGLSQLATYVGPAMVRPALERARKAAPSPKLVEIADWALRTLDEPEG